MNKVILNASQEEEIQQLCNKFEEWRKEKKSLRKRIPEELWLEAIKLAEKYSVCQVSKRLRLGYLDLKKRMRDMNAGDRELMLLT
jgi:Tfp pilus assembly protein PilN